MIGFGKYGKKREFGNIVSMDDERLLPINPKSDEFYDIVLGYVTDNDDIREFVEAIKEVKEAELDTFWKPIYDPSFEEGKVVFNAGNYPAVGHSFNEWKQYASEIPAVGDRNWRVGSEYEYYAFQVWLINKLVNVKCWSVAEAIEAVVIDSKELGHYRNSDNAIHDFEKTGRRAVCGVCDLGNTYKMLECTNQAGVFWLAGGNCNIFSDSLPLADLDGNTDMDDNCNVGVGWLVLS